MSYSSTLSLTSALVGMVDQGRVLTALFPGKRTGTHCTEPVHIVQKTGWAPGSVWKNTETFAAPGFDMPKVQSVASG